MIIDVLVEINVGSKNQMFSYNVKEELQAKIKKGIRVTVPFGSRKLEGFVMDIRDSVEKNTYDLKEIINVVDDHPVLTDELLELGHICLILLAPLIHCYQTMLPVALKAKEIQK